MSNLKNCTRLILICGLLFLLTTVVVGTDMFNGEVNWENGQITVVGFGAPPEGASKAQAKLLAQRAAKADAYRNALEIIEGIRVSSETTVQDYVTTNDLIYTQVQGFIQGGIFTKVEYDFDGVCQVTLVLPIGGQKSLVSMMRDLAIKDMPETVVVEPLKPETQPEQPKPGYQNYTGIIFDARGLNVKPALYPQIFDSQGYLLYGPTTVDVDQSGFTTMVAYSRDMEKAKAMERVGSTPLIVTVASTVKSSLGGATDIVLDSKTAEAFLKLKGNGDYINRGAVVFVID